MNDELKELLQVLGIPWDGEIEVYEMPDPEAGHLYGGWYKGVGQVTRSPSSSERSVTFGRWSLEISSQSTYGVGAFEGRHSFELHFLVPAGDYIVKDVPT